MSPPVLIVTLRPALTETVPEPPPTAPLSAASAVAPVAVSWILAGVAPAVTDPFTVKLPVLLIMMPPPPD